MTETGEMDAFDLLAAAAARVLRRALEGAADMRAAGDRPEQLLQQLEGAVAGVIREAHLAADGIATRAPSAAPAELSLVPPSAPASADEDAVRLRGGAVTPPEKEPPLGPVVLRRRTPS